MTINRKTVTVGLATVALVGLTGGGIAWATTGADPSVAPGPSASSCAGGGGPAYGAYSPMTAVADYLGLTRAELVSRLHSGQSLAEIAEDEGKSVAGLEAAMVSAMRRALADADLTPGQRDAILARMRDHLDVMVSRTRMGDMDADDMRAMMGRGTRFGWGGGMMGGWGGSGMGFGNGMMGD